MKKTLLILITLCISIIGYSQTVGDTFIENFITYEITSITPGTVKVIDYDMAGGTVVDMLASVPYNSANYSVTNIQYLAFQNNGLTSVIIPDSVISIGNGAFSGNVLMTAIIGNSVTSIGAAAFQNNQLISVNIPDSVISIGNAAFLNNMMTSVTIGNSVASIGDLGFANNPLTCVISNAITPPTITTTGSDTFLNLSSNINLTIPSGTYADYVTNGLWTGFASVAEGLSGTFVVDNITYQINPNPNNEVTITDYNTTTGGTVVNIPASVNSGCTDFSVVSIGTNAFNGKGLTSVTIANSVTNIGNSAFRVNNLTSIIIPDSVITIDEGAFVQNNNLNSLVIGNNVTSIGDYAFRLCDLTNVTIPNSVLSIGVWAFMSSSIINLNLGNSVETIGNYAFADNDIASVIIPDSVTSIGDYAFEYSDNMTNLVIGNSVTSIGDFAFAMNASLAQLTTVSIPSSVTTIGNYAFSIASLTDVYSEGTIPPTIITGVTTDTFNYRSTIHLHIPSGTMGAYVTDAGALWTGFNPVTQDALGTSDFELANNIKIITTTGEIKVTFSDNIRLQNYTMYNISGVKVAKGDKSEIPTTYLASGIYIIKLDFDKGMFTKKIVVN